ncbi:unnamed protein product [Musa acuminata subsp. burmannicoides]
MTGKARALGRYVMEAAPPQVVSPVRYRVAKILDTIAEEERETDEASSSSSTSSASWPVHHHRRNPRTEMKPACDDALESPWLSNEIYQRVRGLDDNPLRLAETIKCSTMKRSIYIS